jgi:rRNA processing protein Krr1/Pno1
MWLFVPSNIARKIIEDLMDGNAKSNTRGRRRRIECHRFQELELTKPKVLYWCRDKNQALKDLDFKKEIS